jgi:hypothetical protein
VKLEDLDKLIGCEIDITTPEGHGAAGLVDALSEIKKGIEGDPEMPVRMVLLDWGMAWPVYQGCDVEVRFKLT